MSQNISQFLEKFKAAILGEDAFREDVALLVKEKTTQTVETKCVSFKNRTVYIKSDPYLKTEILINKDEILSALRRKYPAKDILDIV